MAGSQSAMLGYKATLKIKVMDKDSQYRINFKEMRVPHDHRVIVSSLDCLLLNFSYLRNKGTSISFKPPSF